MAADFVQVLIRNCIIALRGFRPFAGRMENLVSDARGKTRLSSVISPDHAAEVTAEVFQLFIPK